MRQSERYAIEMHVTVLYESSSFLISSLIADRQCWKVGVCSQVFLSLTYELQCHVSYLPKIFLQIMWSFRYPAHVQILLVECLA